MWNWHGWRKRCTTRRSKSEAREERRSYAKFKANESPIELWMPTFSLAAELAIDQLPSIDKYRGM